MDQLATPTYLGQQMAKYRRDVPLWGIDIDINKYTQWIHTHTHWSLFVPTTRSNQDTRDTKDDPSGRDRTCTTHDRRRSADMTTVLQIITKRVVHTIYLGSGCKQSNICRDFMCILVACTVLTSRNKIVFLPHLLGFNMQPIKF